MGDILSYLADMGTWHWLTLALILLVLELLTGGTTFLLWPAAAAFVVALIEIPFNLGGQAEWLIFAVLTLIFLWVGQVYIRPMFAKDGDAHLNERSARMVGQTAEVKNDFVNGEGRVRVGDTSWEAKGEGAFKAGTKVVIDAVDGVTLHIRKA